MLQKRHLSPSVLIVFKIGLEGPGLGTRKLN